MSILKSILHQSVARLTYRHAIAYAQKQSHRRAVETFTQAIIQNYSRPAEALVRRGISRISLQDREGALTDFEAVIYTERESDRVSDLSLAQAYFHRGKLRQQSGQPEEALADWEAAITHCPTYAPPYYHRALFLLEQGQPDKAMSDLDAAIKADPTLAAAYLQRGNLRHQLGDSPGAVSDWEYAVCNDFTLETARQKLENFQQETDDAQLSQSLARPLAAKGLGVRVQQKGDRLDIQIHREVGTGISYYTLPDLIREHLVPLCLADVTHFRLIGRAGDANRPDWDQSYALYRGQSCPASNWQGALLALLLFPPMGVSALVLAVRVKLAYKRGKYADALRASKAVKGFCFASSVPFCLFMLVLLSYTGYEAAKENPTFSVVKKDTRSPSQNL